MNSQITMNSIMVQRLIVLVTWLRIPYIIVVAYFAWVLAETLYASVSGSVHGWWLVIPFVVAASLGVTMVWALWDQSSVWLSSLIARRDSARKECGNDSLGKERQC